jgi:hypothetical protein
MFLLKSFVKFILFSTLVKYTFTEHIIYPFKKAPVKSSYSEEVIVQNDLMISLDIGTPPQSINLNLRSKYYTFFVSSKETNLTLPTFNPKISTSIRYDTDTPTSYGGQEYKYAYKIYESIYINGKEVKGVSLLLATILYYYETGALGLRLTDVHEFSNEMSFIYQMKELYNLDRYSFFMRYKDDDNGELIIGTYPHLYDKKYNEKNFLTTHAGKINNNVNWVLEFDLIKYDNKSLQYILTKSLVQVEYNLIQAPYKLRKFFNDEFFHNKCEERVHYFRNISIIHCKKDIDITQFKNISFILKDIEYEFVLTYKDLFIEKKDEYIFGICYDRNVDNPDPTWILGKIFMKKYELVFDLDKKIIGLYTNKPIIDDTGNNNSQNGNEGNRGYMIYLIFIIILVLIVMILMGAIIYFFKNRRKNRANELDDENFEYLAKKPIESINT